MDALKILARKRYDTKGVVDSMPEEYAIQLRKLPERVASIVGKTFAELGDAASLSDDQAVGMIRDLLLELDEQIIEQNRNKRLPRR